MIAFDPSEISQWAQKPDAPSQFPELIRRLILATVPKVSLVDMPSGSSVWLPGWDGVLVVQSGNPWVPQGASAWELSCQGNTKAKATADYNKRTEDPKGIDILKATFMFGTPRMWPGKSEWIRERLGEHQWADVRGLNASDLAQWLEQAPAVADSFARLIGKLPADGIDSLNEWWASWSAATDPKLIPELVLAGRDQQANGIGRWAEGDPSQIYVQGETRAEAIAFMAASAHVANGEWGSALFSKALVVRTAAAWRSIESHPFPLVLIRDFEGERSPQIAISKGHHVFIPLDTSQDSKGNGYQLPRLGRDETVPALTAMGLTEARARSLTRSTARNLHILRRQLIDAAGGPTPEWASSGTPGSLVALILIGQWEENHEGDKQIVEHVVSKPYAEVARDIAALVQSPDSPVVKVGSRWRFVSHEEAWHLLAPRLTSTDMEQFRQISIKVLGRTSPMFELPVEERYMASLKGKVLTHSDTLRSGIARTLALMGTHPDRAKNAASASIVPTQVVSAALGEAKGWQIWATLSGDLSTLAEAAPEALMEAVERDLSKTPSPFSDLFAQEGDGIFGGAPHCGLLWALEQLAWCSDHFSRVASILARLAEIDPGGKTSNRPAASLRTLFLPRPRFSEATDDHRLQTMSMLLDTVPNAGWHLLISVYPSGVVILRNPPQWRPWAQEGAPVPTFEEMKRFGEALGDYLLERVASDASRWADLIGILRDVSPERLQEIIKLLSERAEALKHHPDANMLWGNLRQLLSLHRSHPDAGWAITAENLEVLADVYENLTPTDHVAANSWLFAAWPQLPEGQPGGYADHKEKTAEARRTAVRAVYENHGLDAIVGLANAAESPGSLGFTTALELDRESLQLALQHVGPAAGKLEEFACGLLSGLFSILGWPVLEEALAEIKAGDPNPEVVTGIYLAAPVNMGTWQRIEVEEQAVQSGYWSMISRFNLYGIDPEEVAYAARQLVAVRRSPTAVDVLASMPTAIPIEVVVTVLEAIPSDMKPESAEGRTPHLSSYDLAQLFERLEKSPDVSDEVIAKLEIPFVEVLSHDRPNLALHREVIGNPSTFADLLTWAYKRSDGSEEGYDDDQAKSSRALIAYQILWRLRGLPGLVENAVVEAGTLSTWISEARRLCRERGREEVGDDHIGHLLANAPADLDGIWPCEPVRNVLDAYKLQSIGDGFVIGVRNLRGITSRGVFDGGVQERSLADSYFDDASKIAAKWPFTAQLLRDIAESYNRQGQMHDQESDWRDRWGA